MNSPKETKAIRQFNLWSESYDQGLWSFYFRAAYKKALSLFPGSISEHTILDIGCGTGELCLLALRKFKVSKVIGVDISPKMIEIAKNKSIKNHLDQMSSFLVASASNIPLEENQFENVFLLNSLHHHEDPVKSLSEIYRLLKNKGEAVILDPFLDNYLRRFWTKLLKVIFSEPEVEYYSAQQICLFAKQAGLEVVQQKKYLYFALITVVQKNA